MEALAGNYTVRENIGSSRALNLLFSLCNIEFFYVCSSDIDILPPFWFFLSQQMLNAFNNVIQELYVVIPTLFSHALMSIMVWPDHIPIIVMIENLNMA